MVIRVLHPTGHAFHTTKLFHHFHQAVAAHFLHHVLHFAKLTDRAVDVLHLNTSAGCNAALRCWP